VPGIARHDDYAFEQGITAPTVLSAFTAKSSRRPRYMSREELEKIWDGRVIIVAPKRPRKDTGIDAVIGSLKSWSNVLRPLPYSYGNGCDVRSCSTRPLIRSATMANRTRREKGAVFATGIRAHQHGRTPVAAQSPSWTTPAIRSVDSDAEGTGESHRMPPKW
jgi:hypothetical protein